MRAGVVGIKQTAARMPCLLDGAWLGVPPAAFHEVVAFVRRRDRDRSQGVGGALLGLVLIVLLGGVMTTWMTVEHVAGSGRVMTSQEGGETDTPRAASASTHRRLLNL